MPTSSAATEEMTLIWPLRKASKMRSRSGLSVKQSMYSQATPTSWKSFLDVSRVCLASAVAEGLAVFAPLRPFRDDIADKLCGIATLGEFALVVVARYNPDPGEIRFRRREHSEGREMPGLDQLAGRGADDQGIIDAPKSVVQGVADRPTNRTCFCSGSVSQASTAL